VKIVWDEPKRLANIAKHGLDFADVDAGFFRGAVVRAGKERRFRAFGLLDGRLVALVFAPLGSEAIALVSLRRASVREARKGGFDG
jgi:uncharacterized DUF497 family protein